MNPDVRWKQRFDNFSKALVTLQKAVELAALRPLSELEQQGLIQGFEFTHELAWNVLKDFLEEKGISGLIGSRDATRSAFRNGLVEEGEAWMDMIKDRNLTSHTYHQVVAARIADNVLNRFYPAFQALHARLEALLEEDGR
ncbi:MAG: nucleotidyltransferase substrate binding protein family [Proteobacteria bacterium]|nr:nucleotidyltransferase substrate binding protein family [Pseudomonadota bacterium]